MFLLLHFFLPKNSRVVCFCLHSTRTLDVNSEEWKKNTFFCWLNYTFPESTRSKLKISFFWSCFRVLYTPLSKWIFKNWNKHDSSLLCSLNLHKHFSLSTLPWSMATYVLLLLDYLFMIFFYSIRNIQKINKYISFFLCILSKNYFFSFIHTKWCDDFFFTFRGAVFHLQETHSFPLFNSFAVACVVCEIYVYFLVCCFENHYQKFKSVFCK